MTVLGHSVTLLRVRDVDAEARFYAAWLGLETKRHREGFVATFHIPDGPELELVAGGEPVPPVADRQQTPCIAIYHVEDVAGIAQRAEELGGRIVNPPFQINTSTLAYIADPEGHVIGLSSRNQSKD